MILTVILVFLGVVLVVLEVTGPQVAPTQVDPTVPSLIYGASGPPGQVQELQERSRTIRSISRMIRSSSRTTFKMVFLRFKKVLGGFLGPLRTP